MRKIIFTLMLILISSIVVATFNNDGPLCGNDVCEEGEANPDCSCETVNGITMCPSCVAGTCPQDCTVECNGICEDDDYYYCDPLRGEPCRQGKCNEDCIGLVNNFEECVEETGIILESFPRQCYWHNRQFIDGQGACSLKDCVGECDIETGKCVEELCGDGICQDGEENPPCECKTTDGVTVCPACVPGRCPSDCKIDLCEYSDCKGGCDSKTGKCNKEYCGDGICQEGEDDVNCGGAIMADCYCSQDCGNKPVCGDGKCESVEKQYCPPCTDELCPGCAESIYACKRDCEIVCGDGICHPDEKRPDCPLGAPCADMPNYCDEDCSTECKHVAMARPGPGCDAYPIYDEKGCVVSYNFECNKICPDTSNRPKKEGCEIVEYKDNNGCDMYKYRCDWDGICPKSEPLVNRENCEIYWEKDINGCKNQKYKCEQKLEVDGEEIEVKKRIVLRDKKLYMETGQDTLEIKVLPEQASQIARERKMTNLKVILEHVNDRAVYKISGKVNYRPWWTLWLVELEKDETVQIDAENGEEI